MRALQYLCSHSCWNGIQKQGARWISHRLLFTQWCHFLGCPLQHHDDLIQSRKSAWLVCHHLLNWTHRQSGGEYRTCASALLQVFTAIFGLGIHVKKFVLRVLRHVARSTYQGSAGAGHMCSLSHVIVTIWMHRLLCCYTQHTWNSVSRKSWIPALAALVSWKITSFESKYSLRSWTSFAQNVNHADSRACYHKHRFAFWCCTFVPRHVHTNSNSTSNIFVTFRSCSKCTQEPKKCKRFCKRSWLLLES